jgi:hypothetical protein
VAGGGGYGSQDSATLVMGCPGTPTGLRVQWPGGKVTEAELGAGVREVTVGGDGILQR